VIHGGGNTSVKTRAADFLGQEHDVLCVKGSGWDLATIEPPGLPAVYLKPLQKIRERQTLTDEDMVAFLRANLLEASSPNPSVETLLHAFLPHKFVDHTHTVAVLALSNQPDGIARCKDLYGDKVAILPYVMPGFDLAKATADLYDANPDVEGILLHKHGLFTFGDTAEQSYRRLIELVTLAENGIAETPAQIYQSAPLPPDLASAAEDSPTLRGACAEALGLGPG